MTRYHNSEINLKSSVYNLAGENYFAQLSAYNSMRCHIRRILLAKSVVDSRNNKYINNKRKQQTSQLSKRYSLDNLIDQLAYDTKHHPEDVLRMNLEEYCARHSDNRAYLQDTNNITCSQLKMQTDEIEDNIQTICANHSLQKPKKNTRNKCVTKRHIRVYQKPLQRIVRCEEKPIYVTCGDTVHSDSGASSGSVIQDRRASSSLPRSLQNYNRKRAEMEEKEDARYVAFAYGITREIIKCGLYTDKELNEIFKKHIKRFKTTLDLNKMLREIYRLKTFLNVSEESDETDDDIEVCNAHQVLQTEARPPTPPKVLDDNKVIGKLLSYQKLMENQHNKESNCGKSVVLIDANPELLVTERDVLTSLLEVGIDPKQAENICKSLHHKSMESVLENMAELKIESAPSEKLESVAEVRAECCVNVCCDDSTVEYETSSGKENKCSTTDDLTSKQDEKIQTQLCPEIVHNDNYTEPMCTTFSQLRQENLPLNVDEVIQTEEICINIGTRVKKNKLGVQITEVFQAKEKFISDNMDISNIPECDILAWSRDKIAALKANATNVPEKQKRAESTEDDHRIPITKSTEKLLSSQKRRKSPKATRSREQVKLRTQRKKTKKDRTPQRSGPPKALEIKSIEVKSIKSGSVRAPRKRMPQKKGKRNPAKPIPSKAKIQSTSTIKDSKTDTEINEDKKCVSEITFMQTLNFEESKEHLDKCDAEPDLTKRLGCESSVSIVIKTPTSCKTKITGIIDRP